MPLQPKHKLTPEEYIAMERESEMKSEFLDGETFLMGGASERHNLIVLNIAGELRQQMKGRPCKAYSNDMRVKISPTGLYTYPDVIGISDEARFDDEQRDTLLNPTVIVEVLSKSTEAYDRGDKFGHYRKIDTLREYLLVSQDKYLVEHYIRKSDENWLLSETAELDDSVDLPSIGCILMLSEIYDKVADIPSEPGPDRPS